MNVSPFKKNSLNLHVHGLFQPGRIWQGRNKRKSLLPSDASGVPGY